MDHKSFREYQANASCYEELSCNIASVLNDVGVCVIDNYIPNILSADCVLSEVKQLYSTPHLFQKGAECDDIPGHYEPHRSDYIHWLNGQEETSTKWIEKLEKSLEVLMASCVKLKQIPKLSHKSRFQVSCFPRGSFGYKRHTDNSNNNGRLLTAVYYCVDRDNQDGATHRFHVSNGKGIDSFDIEPKFNRVVIYWSDNRVYHEIPECNYDLFSLSSWYFHSLNSNSFSR